MNGKDEKEILLHIDATLDKILWVLSKPPSLITRICDIVASVVTILGIIAIIDVIFNWIGG